jgi:hypothetical protein
LGLNGPAGYEVGRTTTCLESEFTRERKRHCVDKAKYSLLHHPGADDDAAVLAAVKNKPCGWPLKESGHS